ncbi:MAG: hypothetical protein LBR20_01625, partial [Propionibacteriaceae bacterium]|nr:hypothetical protein [Propionibacteriaceae bacterium]
MRGIAFKRAIIGVIAVALGATGVVIVPEMLPQAETTTAVADDETPSTGNAAMVGTRILPDYGAGVCSDGEAYADEYQSGGSKAQQAACEAAGGSWTYSLTTADANTYERTYAMSTDEVCWVTYNGQTFSVDGVSQAACTPSADNGLTGFYTTDDSAYPYNAGGVYYPQCYIHLIDPDSADLSSHLARHDPGRAQCGSVSVRWGQPANFVAHDFDYSIQTSNGTPLISSVSGAAQSGDSVSGTYYEPVWQGWTACEVTADNPAGTVVSVFDNRCPDGSAPAYYPRATTSFGLFTLPRYDGMIYGFAGAWTSSASLSIYDPVYNEATSLNLEVDTHSTELGSNSLVQPLAINVKQGSGYTKASEVLGAQTTVNAKTGLETVNTDKVDESITVKITPEATKSDYATGDGRYTTAFYTQDWMYWGSEARDASNASPVKWTYYSAASSYGGNRLYDEVTAGNSSVGLFGNYYGGSPYRVMSYIPSADTVHLSSRQYYAANQNGVPSSLDGLNGNYQSSGDPLVNPENPTFEGRELVTAADLIGNIGLGAVYGTASDNDGMIWLGGLGGSG